MYLAYKARNRDFWLNRGKVLLTGIDSVSKFELDSFAFPFAAFVGVCVLALGEVGVNDPRGRIEGMKMAAQRSYSRQSKYDFASRYFGNSSASRRASSGSRLEESIEDIDGGRSTSCIWESGSELKEVEVERGSGSELESSAALIVN